MLLAVTVPADVWTIGHSTRAADDFVAVLVAHGIELLADVRRFPGSRRLPHFDASALDTALAASGIGYHWYPDLGGRRRHDGQSTATGWRNPAFGAYADHMTTEAFASDFFNLLLAAEGLRTAVMCSEVLWWRCHRRLIADLLVSLGGSVWHIQTEKPAEPHRLMPPARLVNGILSYAAPAEE